MPFRPLRFLASLATGLVAILSVQAQTPPPVRIMPLGDSITYGASVAGGYRARLYQLLTTAGYNVDFVGNATGNGVAGLPDSDHEGHSGYRIDQIDTELNGYFAGIADPDVVLLHIGTNDFGQNFSTPTAINRLDALITKIATAKPFAHIIVTNLMERTPVATDTKIQTEFNAFVQTKIASQVALGRRVTFLDMRSKVPLAEMADGLHPNQIGYNHMADTWAPAVQAVIGVNGDPAAPQITEVHGLDPTHVAVEFSKPVADSAATIGNYSLTGGLAVLAAQLDATKRIVTLTTSAQTRSTSYTVTVSNIVDRITPSANALVGANSIGFLSGTPRGYLNNVPESTGYTLVYSLDVTTPANYGVTPPSYAKDNRLAIGPFGRIAYYVELQTPGGELQYAWVSMNAFTDDVSKIGVPTVASQAIFQQAVANLTVASNVAGLTNGTGIAGNIEFWPTTYTQPNGAGVPGASTTTYDIGDTRSATGSYGSMQVHNTTAKQTIFGFNNWGGTATTAQIDLGIGNNPNAGGNPDWTFAANANGYVVKTIQVLVQTTGDTTPPAVVSATAGFDAASIIVSFSEPISAASIRAMNFNVSGGVYVIGATLAANQRDVVLTTTKLPAGPITVTASGVRDTSASANIMTPGGPVTVAPATLPPEIVANVGTAAANYQLVYTVNLPVRGDLNAANTPSIVSDYRNTPGGFTRVAYYLELQKPGGPVQYLWAAMDAFAISRGRVGVPTVSSGAIHQKNVSNLDVLSNVAGVTTGTGMAGGNLEFWPSDYSAANGAAVPNASATTNDFGDTRTTSGGSNFGSMQLHDHDLGKTLFAINHFGTDGNTLDLGIGTQATGSPDWTNAANAGQYSRRVLHVLVLPGSTAPASVTSVVPEAAGYQLAATLNVPALGNLQSGTGFKAYDVDNRSELGQFTRVAYYLELKKPADTASTFIWTSMDAFTTELSKIGVPTTASGALFQQKVNNLTVASNAPGIVTGANLTTGNIEFWAGSYTAPNAANIPGASAALYDFGDAGATTTAGYGSMQVHNYGAAQTLWAINNWGAVGNATKKLCIGIGNNPAPVTGGVDWTFSENAEQFETRLLHVFVLPGYTDAVAPTISGIRGSVSLNRLSVTFSEPVADAAAALENYTLNGGLAVTSATLLSGNREVLLTTSPQSPGTAYTLTVNNVRDRSPFANFIAPGSTMVFTAYTPPAVLANVPETAGYQLAYQLAIPSTSGRWNLNPIPYSIDESKYGEQGFDRVAYLLELGSNWVYASFDPFTTSLAKIGVPSLTSSATAFQQKVTNMNVASNVGSIVTGTGLTGGNIEFWGGNYSAANALNIPNASATLYDFGDTLAAGAYGSMQIHNYEASQTLLAYNNWGSNAATSDLGIGNNPNAGTAGVGGTQAPDWTFTGNAANYPTRNLYVLIRPAPLTASGAAPELIGHPTSRNLAGGSGTTLAVNVAGAGPFTYQWRYNGVAISGANKPWLDLANLTSVQSGSYDVVVTGAGGVSTTSVPATLTIANRLPTFTGYRFTTTRNAVATVPLAALLGKASDLDLNVLNISGAAAASQQAGGITLGAANLVYTPAVGYLGTDSFTVTVSDGQGGNIPGSVQVQVTAVDLTQGFAGSNIAAHPDGKMDTLFRGQPGTTYIVQRSADLAGWTDVQSVMAGDDGLIPFTDANPPAEKAFYRLKPAP